jgi:hypothetical protein
MRDHYDEAVSLAVKDEDSLALDSSSQNLDLLEELGFRPDLVGAAAQIVDGAEEQLRALHLAKPRLSFRPDQEEAAAQMIDGAEPQLPAPHPAKPDWPAEPPRVVLFSGHMVDRPDRTQPRFPEAKATAAGQRIAAELDKLGVAPGDLGVTQAACGGDLLFAQACLARGMRLEVCLPKGKPDYLRDSVSFGAPHWQDDYDVLKNHPNVRFRIMPDDLGPVPESVEVYDRCNRWRLYSALSNSRAKISYVTLWDGKPGDGPGDAEHMVELIRKLTGRQPVIIDPATL